MLVHLALERPSIGQLILLLAGSQARATTSQPHQISLIYRLPDIQHLDHFSLRCSLLILKRSHDLTLIRRDLLLRLHLLLLSRHRRGCFLLWFLRHCSIAFVIFGRRNNVSKRKGIFPRHLHLLVPPHLLQLLLSHLCLGDYSDSEYPCSCRQQRTFACCSDIISDSTWQHCSKLPHPPFQSPQLPQSRDSLHPSSTAARYAPPSAAHTWLQPVNWLASSTSIISYFRHFARNVLSIPRKSCLRSDASFAVVHHSSRSCSYSSTSLMDY